MKLIFIPLMIATLVGCTSPRFYCSAEGKAVAGYESSNTDSGIEATTNGGVKAAFKLLGTSLYITASGSGSILVTRKYVETSQDGTRTHKNLVYLDKMVGGNMAWRVDFSVGIPVASVIPYDEGFDVTGPPGKALRPITVQ